MLCLLDSSFRSPSRDKKQFLIRYRNEIIRKKKLLIMVVEDGTTSHIESQAGFRLVVHTNSKTLHIFSYTYRACGVPLMTGAGRAVEARKMFCMRISASDECSLDRCRHSPQLPSCDPFLTVLCLLVPAPPNVKALKNHQYHKNR